MLAILEIEIQWFRENRTAEGAAQRKPYFEPCRVDDDVALNGEGIFYKQCEFYQYGNRILSPGEYYNMDSENLDRMENMAGIINWSKHRDLYKKGIHLQRAQGGFFNAAQLNIPCIEIKINKKIDNTEEYVINWFDNGMGKPRREKLYSYNETAFCLKTGEAGIVRYNYHFSFFSGQWFKQYQLYFVNTQKPSYEMFLRKYDYEYDQLADLG